MGFPQWINGRIRHLRKALLAVVPQSSWKCRKESRPCIVAHAPVRFFALSQGREENLELIFRPARCARDAFWVVHQWSRSHKRCRQIPLGNVVARLTARQTVQDFPPAQKESSGRIRKNHFPG